MTPQELFNAERRNTHFVDLFEYVVAACLVYVTIYDLIVGSHVVVIGIQFGLFAFVATSIIWRHLAGYSPLGPEVLMVGSIILVSSGMMLDTPLAIGWSFTAMVAAYLCTGMGFAVIYAIAMGVLASATLYLLGEDMMLKMIIPAYVGTAVFMGISIARYDRVQRQLLRVSSVDNLTGAYTRNFLDRIKENRAFKVRLCRPILIDLDDFKGINDIYGHLEGDRVLTEVAEVLERVSGPATLFRFGGDEFMILLFDTSRYLAEDIQAAILTEMPANITCGTRRITGTVGIGPVTTLDELDGAFEKADFEMLNAKGRQNRHVNGDVLAMDGKRRA